MKGHWSYTCRTPKHLTELYQASLKEKDNKDVNIIYQDNTNHVDEPLKMTHLDVEDYCNMINEDYDFSFANEKVED